MSPHVVLLTGGALPADPTPEPGSVDTALAGIAVPATLAELAELAPILKDGAYNATARAALTELAEAAWRQGWAQAGKHLRIVACWVIEDDTVAARFAAFVAAEIDPAYVMAARSPEHELLAAYDERERRTR